MHTHSLSQNPLGTNPYNGLFKFLRTSQRIIDFSGGTVKEPKVKNFLHNYY